LRRVSWNETPQNHVSWPAPGVNQVDAPDLAIAVDDVKVFVLPFA
jgi:hypothetical protein